VARSPEGGIRQLLPRVWVGRVAGLLFAAACAGAIGSAMSAGCNGWSPLDPFQRNSPEVDEALDFIDSGAFESADQVLTRYLGTGPCEKGNIGLPEKVRDKYNGSFDLGLTLFHISEKFGRPFGEEETGDPPVADDPEAQKRSAEIDCALIIVKAIAADPKVPVELRARARYLAGNLEFLRRKYEEAVEEYDQALGLVPGIPEDAGGDGIGRDAAWNRAIALRRIQDQKDAGDDSAQDSDAPDSDDGDAPDSPDADDASDGDSGDGNDGDANDDASDGDGGNQDTDSGADGGKDAGGDGGAPDAGGDGGGPEDKKEEPTPGDPEPATPKDPHAQQQTPDDRILDRLEEAPSYQEEEAKKRAAGRRRGKMEDK
jgi:hypothetical protein